MEVVKCKSQCICTFACISLLSCEYLYCSVLGTGVGRAGWVGGIEELETGEHNINIFD